MDSGDCQADFHGANATGRFLGAAEGWGTVGDQLPPGLCWPIRGLLFLRHTPFILFVKLIYAQAKK